MTFVTRITGVAALDGAMLLSLSATPGHAGYTVELLQEGSAVVAQGNRELPVAGTLNTDLDGGDGTPITGPTSFGSGSLAIPSSGSGDAVGIANAKDANGNPLVVLFVPAYYFSGAGLRDLSTHDNATFSSLGVTPGTYVWTFGSDPSEYFQLTIVPGAGAALPEPSGSHSSGSASLGWR
jgi:hypothetical protein